MAIHFVWKALVDPMDSGFKRVLQNWFPVYEWTTGKALELWSAQLVFIVAFGHPPKEVTCSSISCWMHLLVHMVIHPHLEVGGGALAWWSGLLSSRPPQDAPPDPP